MKETKKRSLYCDDNMRWVTPESNDKRLKSCSEEFSPTDSSVIALDRVFEIVPNDHNNIICEYAADFNEYAEDYSQQSMETEFSPRQKSMTASNRKGSLHDFFGPSSVKKRACTPLFNAAVVTEVFKSLSHTVTTNVEEQIQSETSVCNGCRQCVLAESPVTIVDFAHMTTDTIIIPQNAHSSKPSTSSSSAGGESQSSYLLNCSFCDKMFCSSRCTRQCELCFDTFCIFCTTTNYSFEFEKTVCLDCNSRCESGEQYR